MSKETERRRIESKDEIQTYLDRINYAIRSGSARVSFQKNRQVDNDRDQKYTNRYTMGHLFPDEDEVQVLKRELALLTIEDYIETVIDLKFPKRSEMRVFGKQYLKEDVYIKIRVDLVNIEYASGNGFIFVMSFHYSDRPFTKSDFPYKKN